MSERDPNWDFYDAFAVTGSSGWRQPEGTLSFQHDILGTITERYAEVAGTLYRGSSRDFVVADLTAGNLYYFFVSAAAWSPSLEIFDSEGYRLLSIDGDEIGNPDQIGTDSIYIFSPTVSGAYRLGIDFTASINGSAWEVLALEDIGGDFTNGLRPTSSRVSIAAIDAEKAEGAPGTVTDFTFAVTRTGALTAGQEVLWSVFDGTGVSADEADFLDPNALGGVIIFAEGETQRLVTVQVVGDGIEEGTETFQLRLLMPSAGLGISQGTATGRILPYEAPLPLQIAPTSVAEGHVGTTYASFRVTRGGDLSAWSGTWQVAYGDGSFASPSDFPLDRMPGGTLSFAAGQAEAEIRVPIRADSTIEPDESFLLRLTESGTGRRVEAVGYILDDDSELRLLASATGFVEGTGDGTQLTFTVTRSGPAERPLTVHWMVEPGFTAPVDASDFAGGALPSGLVSFAAGESSTTFTVLLAGDRLVEAAETMRLKLSDASAPIRLPMGLTVTVPDDDWHMTVAAQKPSVVEGSGTAVFARFTITRGDISGSQTVDWVIVGAGDNPVDDTDFANSIRPGGQITFAVGEYSRTVSAQLRTDSAMEADETMEIRLSDPLGGLRFETDRAQMVVVNDDAAISFGGPTGILEGQSGTTPLTVTLHRAGNLGREATVSWTVAPVGTGAERASAADFAGGVLPSGTAVFTVGADTASFTIPIQGDTALEAAERFRVTLGGGGSGITLLERSRDFVIEPDEPVVSITALAESHAEGDGGLTSFTFHVTRSGMLGAAQLVSWAASSGGAGMVDAQDFAGLSVPSGVLAFAAGESTKAITAKIRGDLSQEAPERLIVTLSDPSEGLLIDKGSAQSLVLNDDSAVFAAITHAQRAEGGAFTFTVERRGVTDQAQSVDWRITGDGAARAGASDLADGILPAGRLDFAPGETLKTIVVQSREDRVVEADEAFALRLSGATNGLQIGQSTATATILNDDTSVAVQALGAQTEGNLGLTDIVFTLIRSGDLSAAQGLDWAIIGDGPVKAARSDFAGGVLPRGHLEFAAGEALASITVQVLGDTRVEQDEGFALRLFRPSAGLSIATPLVANTILNDDWVV